MIAARRSRDLLLAASAAVALLAAACSGGSADAPAPSAAELYLGRVLDLMQANAYHRAAIDWPSVRAEVKAAAAGATEISKLDPALRLAFDHLGENHSFIQKAGGGTVHSSTPPVCGGAWSEPGALPAGVAYVRVGSNLGSTLTPEQLAAQLVAAVAAADVPGLQGWIVDLRGNGGGNCWPMLAGISSILGAGDVGAFVHPDGFVLSWWISATAVGVRAGATSTTFLTVSNPHTLLQASPRVAVLTDGGTASSGEIVAIAFRGRADTRSFGAATCGLTSANTNFDLGDGSVLWLAVALDADRGGTLYDGPVAPDEVVSGDAETVARAAQWIQGL